MLKNLWHLLCSLKLAIYLASAATLLLMGGSLLIPGNSGLFGRMDQLALGSWFTEIAADYPEKTWWLYLASLLLVLFGLNTLCCFIDWLWSLRSRWRKGGEYLLHLGVVLILAAYIWGSAYGWRHNALSCVVGELTPLESWPGHYLRVDSFQPVFTGYGPPKDMISEVTLMQGDAVLTKGRVQMNQPLLHDGLIVTPVSFGQTPVGFRMSMAGHAPLEFKEGQSFRLQDGSRLDVMRFLADAKQRPNGELLYRSDRLGNAAFELKHTSNDGRIWQGWYFVRGPVPPALRARGVTLRPVAPLYARYSSLTVNYDPGASLAAAGSGLVTLGVLLALFSFYRKRKHQDRPEI